MAFISGEQGNKGQILRGTGEQRQYWGTGNLRKQIFDIWGTSQFISGEQGNGYPLGGPHLNRDKLAVVYIYLQL